MGSHAKIIRACKHAAARAFSAVVLACLFVVMPAIAQSPLADFEAGKFYHDGDGVPQNFARARSLYERAAGQGNVEAMINLGYMYYVGQGVAQDYDIARDWYIRADRLGSPAARANLAGLYSRGLSSPPAISEINAPEDISKPVVSEELASEEDVLAPEDALVSGDVLASGDELTSRDVSAPGDVLASEDLVPGETIIETPIPETGIEPHMPSIAPSEIDEDVALAKPSFSIAKLIPFLIGFAMLLCLVGIIGIVRFMMNAPRRFVESFTQAHDYGLRRMYSNFMQTAGTAANHEIWLRGVSDMIVRYAHDEDIAATHSKQAHPLQEAAKESKEAARTASASLARHAELLIVKSYKRLGAPD